MSKHHKINRRQFVSTAATASAFTIVPRYVLGGTDHIAPSDKINVGYIGCGSQGLRLLMPALGKEELNIMAVCDPNRKSDDYPTWGPNELKNKVRRFLDDPDWGNGARGGLCGREVGQEIVNRHYAKSTTTGQYNDCRGYVDFRGMLAQEQDLDAVYIMTPEHLHGTIAVHAMRAGKHAIMHKSLSNVLYEARLTRDTARETGVATHMHCSSSSSVTPRLCEWIWGGAIGQVREVHNWTNRPFWPQGMMELPTGAPPVPYGFEWDLWVGPVADRSYHPDYTHAVFRGWYDFGTGALGDMGNYSFHQIFTVMKLGTPLSVQAVPSHYYIIENYGWHKKISPYAPPRASTIQWEFPERGDMAAMDLYWYDGGMRPSTPGLLKREGVELGSEGIMFVGDDGILLAGREPRIFPESRMNAFDPPTETLPRLDSELDQWIAACQGGEATNANFDSIYPQTETVLTGLIALRHEGKLTWNSEDMTFTDAPDANALIHRKYREGWEL